MTCPHGLRRTALFAGGAVLAALLTACGSSGNGSSAAPGPASDTATTGSAASSAAGTEAPVAGGSSAAGGTQSSAGASAGGSSGGRCHTSELRASLGSDNPGAGQEHYPLVLTNTSDRVCTVTGYPGAAFTDAAGRQLGPDPSRTPGGVSPITLAPGLSAWSGLSFSNPGVSGAKSAKAAWLLVTPPNERDSLRVRWTGGAVPVAGTDTRASLTVLAPGTGA